MDYQYEMYPSYQVGVDSEQIDLEPLEAIEGISYDSNQLSPDLSLSYMNEDEIDAIIENGSSMELDESLALSAE